MGDEVTINVTLKLPAIELTSFESWIKYNADVKSLRVIPETEELYKTDPKFKRLVDNERKARNEKLNYLLNKTPK